MNSIDVKRGQLRIIDRDNIFEDVVDMYRTGDIIEEFPIEIKYSDEKALDDGGVQRDMYSAFWEEVYSRMFEGATILIPMVHPHIDMMIYPVLGHILSHGYLVSGHLPVRIALPTLINMIMGPIKVTPQVLLDGFLDYISSTERGIFKDALKCQSDKFPSAMQGGLLDTLSKFGCRQLPTPSNLMSIIERIAEYEFLAKPAAAISLVHTGIPILHKPFWIKNNITSIYNQLTVTAEKVHNLLSLPQASSLSEERVYGYLKTMVGNISNDELRSFLRFVTGSSVCNSMYILVTFNTLSGLGRRPIAHTCDSTLELSTTYINYDDFYGDFQAILCKVNKEFSFRMDAL